MRCRRTVGSNLRVCASKRARVPIHLSYVKLAFCSTLQLGSGAGARDDKTSQTDGSEGFRLGR